MKRFPITVAIVFATLTAGSALALDGQVASDRTYVVRADHRPVYNVNHWILRRTYDDRRERIVNPLAGPPRTRLGRNRAYFPEASPDPFDQVGALRIAGTVSPRRPGAQVLHVDGVLVDVAEERAVRREERFARGDIDVRFHSPSEAYDARFPSVVYLDSQ